MLLLLGSAARVPRPGALPLGHQAGVRGRLGGANQSAAAEPLGLRTAEGAGGGSSVEVPGLGVLSKEV